MQRRWKIRRGDLVQVITGKDKGKQGRVLKVFREVERLVVSGVMMMKRHMKPNRLNPNGGIVEKEATVHVSNVMVMDSSDNKPTRVSMKKLEDGTKVRVSTRTGTEISVEEGVSK